MKRFVVGAERGQSTLLPECLDDWIDESNPVRVIDAFVQVLDLADLGFDGVAPGGAADIGHRLALEEAGDEAKTFIHDGAFLPGHRHPPLVKSSEKCHPCLRNETSPMSQDGQSRTGTVKSGAAAGSGARFDG